MKIRVKTLKKMIAESLRRNSVLSEAENDQLDTQENLKEDGDSVDQQIDRYFVQYESGAKDNIEKNESVDLVYMTKRFRRFLSEAEDAPAETETNDEQEPEHPPDTGDIDVSKFASSVFRLIENPEGLLELKSTIVRRAKNFLDKAYDSSVSSEFEDVMRDQYGLMIGKSKLDVEDEQFVAPPGATAGPSPEGAGGV